MRRLFSGFQTFLAAYPYVPLVLLHVMAVRAAMLIGHWPRPYLDDSLSIFRHDPVYAMSLQAVDGIFFWWLPDVLVGPVLLLLPALALLLLPIALLGTPVRSRLIRLAIGLVGWAFRIADPLRVLAWYID